MRSCFGVVRSGGSANHHGEIVMLSAATDSLILSDDPGGSLLVDLFRPGIMVSEEPSYKFPSVITASQLQTHPNIGLKLGCYVIRRPTKNFICHLRKTKARNGSGCDHLVHLMNIVPCRRGGVNGLEAILQNKASSENMGEVLEMHNKILLQPNFKAHSGA